MTLTVEDGTGLESANAFISLAWYKAYLIERGHTVSGTDAAIEAAIIRATDYLSTGIRWAGEPVKGRGHASGAQALAWPRGYVVDREGYSVPSDSVPVEIMHATAEVAKYEVGTPEAMAPSYVPAERTISETVGEISVTYDLSRSGVDAFRPVLARVRDLVGQFMAGGARLSGGVARV